MKKLLAFYLLSICIEKAFAEAAIEYDVQKAGGEFPLIFISFLVIFGLVWIISKIVKSYSNKKKEIEEIQRGDKIQNVENKNGVVIRHEYVDLGLSVKWANCNVGASSPSDYGNYYAWGETLTKLSYTQKNSITYKKDIGSIEGNPKYDAATANWGSQWRMPTNEEISELVNNCSWEWTTQQGHNGFKVTGSNGNSIFLPAAGYREGASLNEAGTVGFYLGATPDDDDYVQIVPVLNFSSMILCEGWMECYLGYSIRPVKNNIKINIL